MSRSIIIIGAGISGLSAGCYLAMNGYDVRIVEAHSVPGGLCTSWRRNGFLIDGSCHMLMGTGPGNSYHRIWQEAWRDTGAACRELRVLRGRNGSRRK